MSTNRATTGDCPRCLTPVPESRILIEYEVDGSQTAYAECPECEAVIAPVT